MHPFIKMACSQSQMGEFVKGKLRRKKKKPPAPVHV